MINAPGYTYKGQPVNGEFMDASSHPAPVMGSVSKSCRKFQYIAGSLGDAQIKDLLLTKNGLSKETFLNWNPSNRNETTGEIFAWAGYWVCVGL